MLPLYLQMSKQSRSEKPSQDAFSLFFSRTKKLGTCSVLGYFTEVTIRSRDCASTVVIF